METSVHCLFLLVFASCSTWSTEVKSKKRWLNSGDSLTMQCSTTETDYEGVSLVQGLDEDEEIFFLFREPEKLTPGEGYESRLRTEGELNNLTITLANMTVDDSGVYCCKYSHTDDKTGRTKIFGGDGPTMVVVKGRPCPKVDVFPFNLVIVSAISAGSVFFLCLIVLLIWLVPRMKSLGKRHGHARRSDSVYEDMRKSNASHRAHQPPYQTNQYP